MSHVDHRDLIAQYDLGHIQEHSPGLIHWHPNGQRVLNRLRQYVRQLHEQYDYQEVSSPMILHRSLWEQSGHWDKYQSNMFVVDKGDDHYAVKPMSCPGHIAIYKHAKRSYRELPMKLFEFGHVHRNEPSGALSGWMRLRGFVQDDSHVFADPHNIAPIIEGVVKMIEKAYRDFGFSSWSWRLSLRPEQRAGSDALWDVAEQSLKDVCASLGLDVEIAPGEGAFYGPKLEAVLKDRLGRGWQCGVAQLDFVLPERFGLQYQNAQSQMDVPVMVHHAILGSLERWISIVMEDHGALPHWLCPQPVAICPVSQHHADYAHEVAQYFRRHQVPVLVLEDGPLSGRLRQLDQQMVPFRMVVGKQEMVDRNVSVRHHHDPSEVVSWEDAMEMIGRHIRLPD